MKLTKCLECGGDVVDGKQKYHHMKRCAEYKKENVDHVRCLVCGYRSSSLSRHLKLHDMTSNDYRAKYGNVLLVAPNAIASRKQGMTGRPRKPVCESRDAVVCDKCGDLYRARERAVHIERCIKQLPDKWKEGIDYVSCPVDGCGGKFIDLAFHLKRVHGWSTDELAKSRAGGLKMKASSLVSKILKSYTDKHGDNSPLHNAREVAKKKSMEKYGVENPFSSLEVQERILETNRRRYGADHPMQTAPVLAKQNLSAQNGPSELELFFDDNTPECCIFTGYGAKVIPVKKAVVKYGHEARRLCPDFVVLPKQSVETASALSRGRVPMKSICFKYVVELLGDYYHSEAVIGVPPEEHERQMHEAYASVGIEALILWESNVLERWVEIENYVIKWIERASLDGVSFSVDQEDKFSDVVMCSLADASYWRRLEESDREFVVDSLCEKYSQINYPTPELHTAKNDYMKLVKWSATHSRKSSRYGLDCCRHFIQSVADAKVKGKPSLREVWSDGELMRSCILWQFQNENGRHHARRFLNAMCYRSGFRIVGNLKPAKVVNIIRKYGVDNPDGRVIFDPCAGWGGRMLASCALGMKYRGIDANKKLVDELNKMARDLELDAVVVHGDASDWKDVSTVIGEGEADLVFTSPPYFDKEWYSDDDCQSVIRYPSINEWKNGFCSALVSNCIRVASSDGVVLLNVDDSFVTGHIPDGGFFVEDFTLLMDNARSKHRERLLRIDKSKKKDSGTEPIDFVTCRLCYRRFGRLKGHLSKIHAISVDEYLTRFPCAPLQSRRDSQRVSDENYNRPSGLTYKKHAAYRCPDGRIVRKRDAWERAWLPQKPPSDSIVNAGTVSLDKWADQKEGEEYVVCTICGHRGKNITRHVKREHGLEGYDGPLKSESCKKTLRDGAKKTWDTRGRKPERDKSKNKTHKVNS